MTPRGEWILPSFVGLTGKMDALGERFFDDDDDNDDNDDNDDDSSLKTTERAYAASLWP